MGSVSGIAGSATNNSIAGGSFGSANWTNPGNFCSTSSYATYTGTAVTKSLDAYNLSGAGLPSSAKITGCQWTLAAFQASHPMLLNGCAVSINGNVGTPTASNASGTTLTGSASTYTYGGSTDLWGISSANWLASAVNYPTPAWNEFGFSVSVKGATGFTGVASLNSASCTLWYTAVASNVCPAAAIPMPFVLLAGAWIPFTLQLARELAGQVCQFKQTVRPRRVSVGGYERKLVLPRLVLPTRFQADRPSRVIAF